MGSVSTDDEFAAQLREHLTEAFGPEVVHDALDTEEARSYFAARREADAREAAYLAAAKDSARGIADRLSECLPDGMRFEWEQG